MRKQRQKKRMATDNNRCILGSGNIPEWCRNKIMPFEKMNGGVGYEFHGAERDYILYKGDTLVKKGGRILIKRKMTR